MVVWWHMGTRLLIPNSHKAPSGKKLRQYEQNIRDHDNTCMFIMDVNGELCGLHSSRRHSIPKKAVLADLKDIKDGKVLEFRWGIGSWRDLWNRSSQTNPVDLYSSETFEPPRVGISDASVGHFACGDHDDSFSPIDVAQHGVMDQTTAVLTAYRTSLYVGDLWRKYQATLHGRPMRELVRSQGGGFAMIKWAELLESSKRLAPKLESKVGKLGSAWYSREEWENSNTSIMGVHRLCFRSRLRFAASMIFSEGCFVTVCPSSNDSHTMSISYLAEDESSLREDLERLTRIADATQVCGDYGVEVVNTLLSNGFGSMAASPHSYEELADEERETVQGTIRDSSQSQSLARIFSDKRN